MKLTDKECRRLIEMAVDDERVACCEALCPACLRGSVLLPGYLHRRRERGGKPGSRLVLCKAAAIHARRGRKGG